MYGHHLLYSKSNMDQPCKVAKPARGKLNREIKRPCRYIRGKYILYTYWCSTAVGICLFIRYIFNLGTCTFVHDSLLYMHIYIYIYIYI